MLTAVGIAATVFFHIFLKANLLDAVTVSAPVTKSRGENGSETANKSGEASRRQPSWIGTSLLLRVALLYVASRLFITLATVYLPLYIEETDVGGKQALATVPLTSYLASFVAALGLKYINRSCGTKVNVCKIIVYAIENLSSTKQFKNVQVCYLLGALIGILASTVTAFGGNYEAVVYSVAVLIGAASSVTMVTALSVTAEIIGPRTESSALVYSIVTFLDKIITGIVVIFIEKWQVSSARHTLAGSMKETH